MALWLLVLLLPGTIHICKAQGCDEFTVLKLGHAIIGTSLSVRLLLYTRVNATCGRLLSHQDPSAQAQFNLSRPTTMVIHGFRPTGAPPGWINDITQGLLGRADVNVLVVDWNHGAANINYGKVVQNSRRAASNLTAFIQNMQNHGASLSSIHMIGVSIGAHIAGFVGADLRGQIGRITALDPAGPQFNDVKPEDRLDPTDAQFVDVLHTDMDALGYRKPLGHIDFYANGGADQPGCPKTIFSGPKDYFKCDHQRSVFLYMGSLQTCDITAFPCSSYTDFLDGRCTDCPQFDSGCPLFGYDIIRWKDTLVNLRQTMAFFTTNEKSPYCRTNYRVDIVTWNQNTRWCFFTIKLNDGRKEAKATINHKASKLEKYTETRLLAQFDLMDLQTIQSISVKFSTRNAFKPKYKLRVLRIRLTHLEHKDRPLCRYDLVLEENRELTFRPLPCEESNF